MDKNKKNINLTINDLNIPINHVTGKINIKREIYDNYILYSLSESSIKNKNIKFKNNKFSKFITNIDHEVFNNKFDFVKVKEENDKINIEKYANNYLIVTNHFGFNTIFQCLRNCIAHGNIILYKNYYYLFQVADYKKSDTIDNIINKKLKFLLKIKKLDYLSSIYNDALKFKKEDK